MKKNLKFFGFMACLNEEEVIKFGKYLRFEYPNEGNALQVFNYYKRFYPGKENPDKMALPYAFRKIFDTEMGPGLNDSKKLWNAFSKLYLWLKDFLVLEKLRADRYTSDVLWLKVLSEKGLTSEYSKKTTESYKTKYYQFFDTEACLKQIELSLHFKQQLVLRSPAPDYKAIESCLLGVKECAGFISLKINCELLSLKKIGPSKEKLQSDKKTTEPLALIYDQIFLMITTGNVEHYIAIEKLLYANINEISSDETNTILRYLQNFAAKMIREHDAKIWGKKFHELNKALIERDIHATQNTMWPINFQNIVNVACAASDMDWASEFITKYSQYLPQKVRSENVIVAQATIAFERKDFKKVIELLGKPKFKDEVHVIRSKTLQLRALYELGMDVTTAFEAFNTYLQRHRYPETKNKEAVIAFMAVFHLLLDLKTSRKELKHALDANPQIILRDWLEEKIRNYRSTVYQRNK